jgi:hypothetical protein
MNPADKFIEAFNKILLIKGGTEKEYEYGN